MTKNFRISRGGMAKSLGALVLFVVSMCDQAISWSGIATGDTVASARRAIAASSTLALVNIAAGQKLVLDMEQTAGTAATITKLVMGNGSTLQLDGVHTTAANAQLTISTLFTMTTNDVINLILNGNTFVVFGGRLDTATSGSMVTNSTNFKVILDTAADTSLTLAASQATFNADLTVNQRQASTATIACTANSLTELDGVIRGVGGIIIPSTGMVTLNTAGKKRTGNMTLSNAANLNVKDITGLCGLTTVAGPLTIDAASVGKTAPGTLALSGTANLAFTNNRGDPITLNGIEVKGAAIEFVTSAPVTVNTVTVNGSAGCAFSGSGNAAVKKVQLNSTGYVHHSSGNGLLKIG